MAGFFKSQDRLSKKSSFEQAYFGTLILAQCYLVIL